jgi:hypothetical protein
MAFGDGPSAFGASLDILNRPTDRFTPSQQKALGERGLFGFLPETEFGIGSTANQVFQGFISGFTGFNFGDDPQNSVEAIARSVGGVAGFLGFVPGPGLAGKLGARGVAKAFGATRLAERVSQTGAAFQNVRSVPLFVADTIIDSASRLGKNNAFLSSVKFLNNSRATDAVTEGVRLGIASGFSAPWTEGVGEIALQTGLGALDGLTFNLVNSGVRKYFQGALGSSTERTKLAAEGAVRGIANAMFNGLQGEIMNPDAPLEMQVFDYLLGFGFGVIDKPYEIRKAQEFMSRRSRVDLLNLDKLPDFQALDPRVQEELVYQQELLFGKVLNQSGDTSAGSLASEAIRQLYDEYYTEKSAELSGKGLSEDEVFDQANQFAAKQTGIPFWQIQQNENWTKVGDDLSVFFNRETEGKLPELHIGPMPGGDVTFPIRYDKNDGRLFIDEQILQKKLDESGEKDARLFMERTALEEYYRATSAEGVDFKELARKDLLVFEVKRGIGRPKEEAVDGEDQAPAASQATYKSSLGGQATGDQIARQFIKGAAISIDDITRATSERLQAIEDHDIASILVRPIDNFANSIAKVRPEMQAPEIRKVVYEAFSNANQVAPLPEAVQERPIKGLDLSGSTKKGNYFGKDNEKASRANKFIGRGSDQSSTNAYAVAAGNKANTGDYDSSDVVFVSAEGARANRIAPDFDELKRAADKGVKFITDKKADRERTYNVGEREVELFLKYSGYKEESDGVWKKPTEEGSEKPSPVAVADPEKSNRWNGIVARLKESLGEDAVMEGSPQMRDLRRAWKLFEQNELVKQGFWSRGGLSLYGTDGLAGEDGAGNPILKSKAPTHLDSALRKMGLGEGFIVEKMQDGRSVDGMFEDMDFDDLGYILQSYRDNKPFIAGTKDKGRNHHTFGFSFEKSEGPRLFREKLAAISGVEANLRAKGVERIGQVEADAQKLFAKFQAALRERNARINDPEDKFTADVIDPDSQEVRDAWESIWVQNVKILEEVNGGLSFETMMEANLTGKGQFVLTPHGLNKRMQILDDGSPVADPSFYPEDAQDLGGTRAIVVRAKGFTMKGVKDVLLKRYGKDGALEDFIAEHHLDGVVFERHDVFDARLKDIGGDPEAGVIKGSTVFANEQGMFIGKMAIFRAPDYMSPELDRMGIHQVYMDSATKQRGLREQYDMRIRDDGSIQFENPKTDRHVAIAPENLKTFVVPFEGQRMNMSVGESPRKAKKDQHAPVQIHTTITDPVARDHFMRTYVEPAYRGDAEHNAKLLKFQAGRGEDHLNDIDWDKVGVDELVAIYTEPGAKTRTDNEAYSQLINHIMKKAEDDPSDFDLDDPEDFEALESIQQFSSAADRILSLWKLTPATTSIEFVRPFIDAAFRNYIMNRVQRPVIPYSGKVIAGPADPMMRKATGFKPGFVYLDDSWKSKTIRWMDGKEAKLGDAYAEYQAASGAKKEAMEKLLTFATIRVPADSASGTRMLVFGGFTGNRGAGGAVHNEEMINLGGMDLDIDSFFIFQDIDASEGTGATPIRDYFNANRNQWLDENGVIKDSKPEENDIDWVVELENFEKHPIAAADPRIRMSSSAGAYRGNRMLGIGAVAGRRGDAWHQAAINEDDRARRVVLSPGRDRKLQKLVKNLPVPPNARLDIMINPSSSREAFDAARREAMNRSADAGDFPGFKQNKFTVGNYITERLVGGHSVRATFTIGKGKNAKTVTKEFPLSRLGEAADQFRSNPNSTELWKMMSRADELSKGRDYGTRITASRAWNELKRAEGFSGLRRLPDELKDDNVDYTVEEIGDVLAPFVGPAVGLPELEGRNITKVLREVKREKSSYTLGRTMQSLSDLAPGLELENSFYRILKMVGETEFQDRSSDASFVNTEGMNRLARLFNQVYNEDSPGADVARKAIGRNKLNVSEFDTADLDSVPGWAIQQDIADIASAAIVKEAVDFTLQSGVPMRRVVQVTDRVEGLKNQYKLALEHKPAAQGDKAQVPDDVRLEAEEYAKGLSVPEKKLFDIYMLGSLFRQDSQLNTLRKNIQEEGRENGWSKEAIDARTRSQTKEWYKTNFQRMGFQLDIIDPVSVKEFGEAYNAVVQATMREKLSENEVRELIGRAKVEEAPALETTVTDGGATNPGLDGASTLNEAPAVEKWADTFLTRAFGLSEDARKSGLLDNDANKQRVRELKDIMRSNPNMRHHFAEFFATTIANNSAHEIGVVPNRATLEEFDAFVGIMKDADRGRTLTKVVEGKPIPRTAYFMFPETWASMLDPFDSEPHNVAKKILTEQGPKTVETLEFNSTAREVLRVMNQAIDAKDGDTAEVTRRINDRFRYMFTSLKDDATRAFEAVVAKFEMDAEKGRKKQNSARIAAMEAEWTRHKDDFEEVSKKQYHMTVDGELKSVSGEEIMKKVRRDIEEHTKEDFDRYIRNDEEAAKFFVYRSGGSLNVQKTLEAIDLHRQKTGKIPMLGVEPVYRMIYELKAMFMEVEVPIRNRDGNVVATRISINQAERMNMGEEVVDLIRAKIDEFMPFKGVGEVKFGYFPHGNYPEKIVKAHLKSKLETLMKEGASEEDMRKAESMIRRAYGAGTLKDDDLTGPMHDIIMGEETTIRSLENNDLEWRPSNTLGRSDDVIPQWDKSPRALEEYGHKMTRAYHMMLGSLLADRRIKRFEVKKPLGDETKSWARFMRMYVSRAVGNPSIFPKEYLEDKNLNLHKSPYWYFTDQALENGFRKADKRFFGNRFFGGGGQVGGAKSRDFQRKAAWWSRLDASWNMMALLARTKGYVNNLSQSVNTAISTGFDPWKKAMSMRWITSNILDNKGNPVFKSREDIRRFVEASGGVESFIIDDAGLKGRIDPTRLAAFMSDVTKHIRTSYKDGKEANDKTMIEIAKKHNIGQAILNAGGFFMRASERAVRTHSFMAHYIKAREALMVNGFTHRHDDPHLIEMARRGTEATQFMYNNASRPAFAASHFGKVAARFQLWAWNSVKYRRDIYRQARVWGFREGTPEFSRYQRMATIDMLSFALASIFPASFFEATLPQPLGYLNDLSQFFFGQEKEDRERAFFGVLPYPFNVSQVVLPPSARIFTTWITPLMTGDWSRFANYHVWTFFPFGLMARDVNSTLENPIRAVENFTGFPLIRLHQEMKNRQENPVPSFFATEE